MLKGKVGLITGATSGIGRAAAVAFAKAGAKVALCGRREPEGQETVRLVREAGGDALFVKADVSREADVVHLVEATVAHFGRLDIAFNNAGIGTLSGPLAEASDEDFTRMFDVNVRGTFLSMKHELRQFLAQGSGGAIVNCSSVQGHIAMAGAGHYAATKHAVEGYTKMAALEYAKKKIRVNSVSPGVVDDAGLGGEMIPSDYRQFFIDKHPMARFGFGSDIASAVVFLLSDTAGFITGTSLAVDGGYMAQ